MLTASWGGRPRAASDTESYDCTQWGTHSEGRGPAAHEFSLFADTEPPNPVLPVSDIGDTSPSPGAVVAEASAQLEAPQTSLLICYSHGLTTALGSGEEGEDVRMKETWQRIFGSPRSEGTDRGTVIREATEVLRTKVIGQVAEWSSDWNSSLLTPGPS